MSSGLRTDTTELNDRKKVTVGSGKATTYRIP